MNIESKKHEMVKETTLSLPLITRGKVRDIYAIGEDKLLMVTTDRISAFDVVMPNPIPDKGKVLNQISLFWFDKLKNIVPNVVITGNVLEMNFDERFISECYSILDGRSMLVYKAKPLPVECIVRGYLVGSGWKDYEKTGEVCGYKLPQGLKKSDRLPQPIFTPSTKATVGHDLNISFSEVEKIIGKDLAKKIENYSLQLYKEAEEYARSKGIIIADTKFEFGIYKDEVVLIDEVLTPDSSRFWPADSYQPGKDQISMDKQFVRDYLEKLDWDKTPPGPELPEEIVTKTSMIYKDIYRRLKGEELA